MSISHRLASLIVILLLPLSVQAFGFSWLFRGQSTSYYYSPSPGPNYYATPVMIYQPCPPTFVPPIQAIAPPLPAPVYATPTPAPPSVGPLVPQSVPAPPPAPRPAPGGAPAPPPNPVPAAPKVPSPPPENSLIPPDKLNVIPPPAPGSMPAPAGKPTPPPAPPPGDFPLVPPVSDPGKPAIRESRSYYNAYPIAARTPVPSGAQRFPIGFWNLSDRALRLTVGGQTHLLPRGAKWTAELPRSFRWQIDGRAASQDKVPDNEVGLEIVIRQ